MEILTMGKVVVSARIENQSDLIRVREGNLDPDKVRNHRRYFAGSESGDRRHLPLLSDNRRFHPRLGKTGR